MIDLSNEWANLTAKLLSEMTLKKEETPPKVFLGAMLNFFSKDMNLGTKPKTILEYVVQNMVVKLIQKQNIKCTGCRLVKDLPIKNTNVYEHSFETSAGDVFYAIQVGFAPINSVEQLTYSILEMKKVSGCMACNFKGFVEEDIECPVCRNGLVRKIIGDNPNLKTFKGHGWSVFSKAIGDKMSKILEDFAEEYHNFYKDFETYLEGAEKLAEEYLDDNDGFGELYGKEIESQLLMSFADLDEEEEEHE